ncbi:hypothetical protein BdWA1_000509 [Babesia duncani]|uniref:Uncharacterized protein n=1 Tax=Babesia duncani TaxID=323732 RepID=A0AAD9PMH0_9APIC|nr:hypothetical protein BdWA1_000509 [Babesia duncani]
METIYGLYTDATSLWAKQCLVKLFQSRKRGIYHILDTFSRPEHFRNVLGLLINCRGDLDDPVLGVFFEVMRHCRSRYRHAQVSNLLPIETEALETVSRIILAAVTPVLIHVYLTRLKVPACKIHSCHVLDAILHDVNSFTNQTNGQLETLKIKWKGRPKCLASFGKLKLKSRSKIEHLILGGGPFSKFYQELDFDESKDEYELVEHLKQQQELKDNPIDNISGLQLLLCEISKMVITKSMTDEIPSSLIQYYQMIPETSNEIKGQMEDAIVYIQRIRITDLEHRLSRQRVLLDALLDHQRITGIRKRCQNKLLKIVNRKGNTIIKTRVNYSEMTSGGLITDEEMVSLVSKCLMFYQEYFYGFNKFCSTKAAMYKRYNRMEPSWNALRVASNALGLGNKMMGDKGSFLNNKSIFSSVLLSYKSLLHLLMAMTSFEFVSITPFTLFGLSMKPKGFASRALDSCNSLLNFKVETRSSIFDAFQDLKCNRLYVNEALIFCILRVHAAVYRLLYCNLHECMAQMDKRFKKSKYIKTGTLIKGMVWHKCQYKDVFEDFDIYSRFIPEYILYRQNSKIANQCEKRATQEMLPKAYWISKSHMQILNFKFGPKIGCFES